LLLFLAAAAFIVYHLYESGQLPFVQRSLEDAAVTGSVRAAFALHRDLSNRPIEVTTHDGVVALSGAVSSETERTAAEDVAANVEGVARVDNRLEVDRSLHRASEGAREKSLGQKFDDVALLGKIRAALHLDKNIRKFDVDIEVSSGRVVIRGEVPSEKVAARIRSRVASVGGVELLEDQLQLPPDQQP